MSKWSIECCRESQGRFSRVHHHAVFQWPNKLKLISSLSRRISETRLPIEFVPVSESPVGCVLALHSHDTVEQALNQLLQAGVAHAHPCVRFAQLGRLADSTSVALNIAGWTALKVRNARLARLVSSQRRNVHACL